MQTILDKSMLFLSIRSRVRPTISHQFRNHGAFNEMESPARQYYRANADIQRKRLLDCRVIRLSISHSRCSLVLY